MFLGFLKTEIMRFTARFRHFFNYVRHTQVWGKNRFLKFSSWIKNHWELLIPWFKSVSIHI